MTDRPEPPCPTCGRPMARVAGIAAGYPLGAPAEKQGWTCVNCNAAGDPEEDHLEGPPDPEPCSCDEAEGLKAKLETAEQGRLSYKEMAQHRGDLLVTEVERRLAGQRQIDVAEGLIAAVMRAMWVSEGLTPQLEDPFHCTVLRIRDALTRVPLASPLARGVLAIALLERLAASTWQTGDLGLPRAVRDFFHPVAESRFQGEPPFDRHPRPPPPPPSRVTLLEEIADGLVDMLDGEPTGSDSLDWALEQYGYKPTKGVTEEQALEEQAAAEAQPVQPWRVGTRIPEHVYIGDRPLVTMPSPELAALVVEAVNARLARG